MTGMRQTGWLLALGSVCWLGCPPPSPGGPDAGGGDRGNWEDTGRLAACNPVASGAPCGELATVDMRGCDTASLGQVPADAVYTVHLRYDAQPPVFGATAFRVSASGTQDYFRGVPSQRQVGGGAFFLSSTRTSQGRALRYSLVGCRAEAQGQRVYGCQVTCNNGTLASFATFEAVRWQRREGEAEASGLWKVAEAPVQVGLPVDVYVTKQHAYVVSLPGRGWSHGALTVFDVSDPRSPVLRKTVSLEGDNNYWNGVWAKGDALYVASATLGVLVFDISNPADPAFVRSVPLSGEALNVHTVFVDGERLYAMSPDPVPQTFIFDVKQPLAPVQVGSYVEPGVTSEQGSFPHDAFAFENRLYINHWSEGYVVVDVADPARPARLGAYPYPHATSHANAVGRFGDRLIAFEGGEDWGAHLRVLDVTDPANVKRLGEFRLDANASIHNLVLKGTRLYVAWYQHGVRVLDVSTPEQPVQVAWYHTYLDMEPWHGRSFYEGAIGMRVPGDGYVYVVDTARGLMVFPEP